MFVDLFEKLGRFFFQRISTPIFLILLSIGPLAAGFYLFSEKQSTDIFQEQFYLMMNKAKSALEKKAFKERFFEMHKNSDPYFIDKEIESLSLLEEEKKRLQHWLSHPAISNADVLAKRLRFIESGENSLSFAEEDSRIAKMYKEVIEKQRHSVEIDAHDLKRVLSVIEETSPASLKANRPQLIITEFSLSKKTTNLQNEIFELKMDLIKREFAP